MITGILARYVHDTVVFVGGETCVKTKFLSRSAYVVTMQEGQKDDKYVVLVVDQFGGKGESFLEWVDAFLLCC